MVQDVRGATCRQTSIYPDPRAPVSLPRPSPVAIASQAGNTSDTRPITLVKRPNPHPVRTRSRNSEAGTAAASRFRCSMLFQK